VAPQRLGRAPQARHAVLVAPRVLVSRCRCQRLVHCAVPCPGHQRPALPVAEVQTQARRWLSTVDGRPREPPPDAGRHAGQVLFRQAPVEPDDLSVGLALEFRRLASSWVWRCVRGGHRPSRGRRVERGGKRSGERQRGWKGSFFPGCPAGGTWISPSASALRRRVPSDARGTMGG